MYTQLTVCIAICLLLILIHTLPVFLIAKDYYLPSKLLPRINLPFKTYSVNFAYVKILSKISI